MRIQRVLRLSAIVAIVSALVVAAVIALWQILDTRRSSVTLIMTDAVRKISVIRSSLVELSGLEKERAAAQWRSDLAELASMLKVMPAVDEPTRALKARIVQEHAAVLALFERLVASQHDVDLAMIRGQLDVRTASMLADVLIFNNLTNSYIERQKYWTLAGIATSILFLAGVVLALLQVLHRRVAAPIAQLEKATALVGAGELDEPVAISGSDEITALARSFESMRISLKKRDRRRDEYLSMLSHELRNPLAPIRTAAHVLDLVDGNSEQAARAKAIIKRQTTHLARLVDDLLDVTRVASGKIELKRETVEMGSLLRHIMTDHQLMIDEHGLQVIEHLPAEPVRVHVDPTRMAQVLGNLLQNAVRFTPPGGKIVVALRADGGHAEVRVSDTGTGIDDNLLREVFEPFTQGEQSLARSKGGLGLGLSLVKGITQLHGGTVSAESPGVGKGATFAVRLPLATEGTEQSEFIEAKKGQGRFVLVVEDNPDAAESLAELVNLYGYDTEIVYDGLTALTKILASSPDLVLCDIGLPGMNGYELARALRARGIRMPLVAVSGYARPEDVKQAEEAGFDGHIAKPVDPEKIQQALKAVG